MKRHALVIPTVLAATLLAACTTAASGGGAQRPQGPSVDTFKQAIDRRLLKLIPDGAIERQVLFGDITAGRTPGSFRATVTIRDYGPGYPKNRYYGETCVGTLKEEDFSMSPDDFGGWRVEGRMTPDLRERTCKANPAEGVSSVPLDTLSGTRASSAPPAGRETPAASAASVATGAYECWSNGQARGLMNFTVRGSGQYVGTDDVPGAFTIDAATTRITFSSGSLAGAMPEGFYAVYHLVQGRPTISFMSNRGAEAVFCQKK